MRLSAFALWRFSSNSYISLGGFPILAALACIVCGCQGLDKSSRPRIDRDLQAKIEGLAQGFEGDVGVYVRHLRTGREAAIRCDELFPTASMIKVPILCGVFDQIGRGELKYDQELVYRESLKYDDGVTGSLKDGSRMPLAEAAMLMVSLSDNTASLWLQQLAGSTNINAWLEANGFHQTRVNSRTPGREAAQKQFGWGQTTPREMAELVAAIYHGTAVSPSASEEMFRVLSKPYWDKEALSQIPPWIHVAAKSGAVNASKSEVVLVSALSGSYVFCIITKNQKDQRWEDDNAGYVIARRLSRLLWEHFEPNSNWKPQPGSEQFRK
jgi:beta-lactamase class A